jgi:hypothetical protein
VFGAAFDGLIANNEDCIAAHTPPEPDHAAPHELAAAFVHAGRLRKHHKAHEAAAQARLTALMDPILEHMKAGRWPTSASVDGANVHRKVDLRASPQPTLVDGKEVYDHTQLVQVLHELAKSQPENHWEQLFPSTVNGNSLAGTFREALRNHEFTVEQQLLPVEERLVIAGVPQALVDVCKITEKPTVNANEL